MDVDTIESMLLQQHRSLLLSGTVMKVVFRVLFVGALIALIFFPTLSLMKIKIFSYVFVFLFLLWWAEQRSLGRKRIVIEEDIAKISKNDELQNYFINSRYHTQKGFILERYLEIEPFIWLMLSISFIILMRLQ